MVSGATFTLIHISCNLDSRQCGEIIKHDRCRLRNPVGENTFGIDGFHYLPYEDTGTGEPKMAFKKLVRYVAFPPYYELLKVNWF
jgi:hypothetical protein